MGSITNQPAYASNSDYFFNEQTLFTQLLDDVLNVTVHTELTENFFVYKTAYVSVSDWVSFDLFAHDLSLQSGSWNDSWIRGSAGVELLKDDLIFLLDDQDLVSADELYVVVFVCREYGVSNIDLTDDQETTLQNIFSGPKGYLCGVANFSASGVLTHNRWSLDTVELADFFTDSSSQTPSCEERVPQHMSRSSICTIFRHNEYGNVDCYRYDAVYRTSFPGHSQARQLAQQRDEYYAFEFSTQGVSPNLYGAWQYIVAQIAPTFNGPYIMTISKCPGDFDREAIEQDMGPDCYIRQSGFRLSVQYSLDPQRPNRCILEEGQTYYLNLVYTNSPAGTNPQEINWQCGSDPSWNVCSHNTAPTFTSQ